VGGQAVVDRRQLRAVEVAPARVGCGVVRDAKTQNFSATVTLISGFQTTSAGARWGRTVDALPGADGDLYVSDDMSGTIYRVGPSA
jgi:glucose/arabinose dehydrogenase